MELSTEVLVVGAGPVGCWLAAELRAAGVRTVVAEARAERAGWSRGFVVHPRTLEILHSRGAAGPLLATGRRQPTWHFAMGSTRLDFTALPTSFPFVLLYPQAQTEARLEEHLNAHGGEVRRGWRVVGLEQEDDGVTARVSADGAEHTVTARFVVGCDGAHSTVREAAGIGFPGDPDTMISPAAHVTLADPPPPERYMQATERGLFFAIPLPDGRFVVSTVDHEVMGDVAKPWTAETLRASLIRVAGTDFGLSGVDRISTIGNSAKQAERYREGRVLLAGDAAHVHFPMGGQGMNLGLQDAHNLAWRLTAAVRAARKTGAARKTAGGPVVYDLLDGYEAERRPAGERVLEDVRAQMALVAATGADGAALRARFEALLSEHPQVNLQYARRLSGIDVRYPAPLSGGSDGSGGSGDDGSNGSGDERLGRRAPDLEVRAAGTSAQLYDLLRHATQPGDFAQLVVGDAAPADRQHDAPVLAVDEVSGPEWALAEGWGTPGRLLVRPDGHVAAIE